MGLSLKSITKPFKKVLKSPIGKAALMLGLGHFGPKMLGTDKAGFGQWGNVSWKDLPWWKAGLIAGGTSAIAGGMEEEDETISISDAGGTGHDDYLRMRQMFVENDPDVWTNKTPMFSRGSQGGRVEANIGLYAGQGGGMNNSMNPMMNQGLGATGAQGMNPYNQQNLMAQGQMRGQPQGRPPMPGGPTTDQGPGITSARLPKQNEDNELIKLIKMLASLGIPMEQLRGRTKEELVEMVISIQSRTQPDGREEVVEEEQEEVLTAAGGGRVHAAGGLGETYPPQGTYPNSDLEFQTEAQASMGNPGDAEMYVEEDEEEEYVDTGDTTTGIFRDPEFEVDRLAYKRAGGGLMRTGYTMGSEQPVIPSKDGSQLDFRNIGGYQPHGKKEKHDDVRALLAQGEFVVTSDAVKGIGGGDRDVGAKRMYDMMHKYEPIGRALS